MSDDPFMDRVKAFDKAWDEVMNKARVPWWKTLWWRLRYPPSKRRIGRFTPGPNAKGKPIDGPIQIFEDKWP